MKQELKDKTIKALKPASAAYEIMDMLPGFGVRVMPSGVKSFILFRRFPGSPNPVRRSLGQYGELSLTEAREKAREWLTLIKRGIDPAVEFERLRKATIEAERARQAATCGAALEDYLLRKAAKLRSGKAIQRELRRAFQRWQWLDQPLSDIHRRNVEAVIREIAKDTPTQAHFVFGMVRTFFNWLVDDGQLEASPCSRIKASVLIGRPNVRDRVLNDYEIRALWKAAEKLGGVFGPFVRLLMLSAARRDEVANSRWAEFDLGAQVWLIPGERMKNGAPFAVPLTADVLRLLQELPRFPSGNYVFSTTRGQRPISGFSKAKLQLDKLMHAELEREGREFEPFVFHDLRRTVRTRLSSLPIEERVRELLLAHSQPGLHRVYDLHSYLEEKRRGLELWHAKLRGIVEPKVGNVIPLAASA